jgi:hypothetical protein
VQERSEAGIHQANPPNERSQQELSPMRRLHHPRPQFFASWIFEALTEELQEGREYGAEIDLVVHRLFRDGAEPLVSASSPLPPARPGHCDVAELSSLLEGDDRG